MVTSHINLFQPGCQLLNGSPLRAPIVTESACGSTEGYSLLNLGEY
jgi:hypothetical protein